MDNLLPTVENCHYSPVGKLHKTTSETRYLRAPFKPRPTKTSRQFSGAGLRNPPPLF